MGRPTKGEKTPGSGRKKGVVNKRTSELEARIKALGLDPLVGLSTILPTLDPKDQVGVYLGIMPYLYSKRKSIELTFEDEQKLEQIKIMDKIPDDHLKHLMRKAIESGKSEIEIDEL